MFCFHIILVIQCCTHWHY